MNKATCLLAASAIALTLIGCTEQQASPVMELPVTTSSDEAREHFTLGLQESDVGKFQEANRHFEAAIEADSDFALAYLNRAYTASSLDEYQTSLQLAVQHAESATEAERLLIEIDQKTFANDMDGALQLGDQLVETEPTSPRALLRLASIQSAMGNVEEARATMLKATVLAPNFSTAHAQLGNSYLLVEPKDFSQAQAHMQKVVELVPNEPGAHDLLGDTYRALSDLESARAHYTQAAELDPANASSPLQQRAHVNSFLGDYDAARADYDSAIAMARGNAKSSYAVFRAFVHVHAGDPQAAIDELNTLVSTIDGMGIPEPKGQKIFALTQVAIIAMHIGNYPAAEQALEQRTALLMMQADEVGRDEFRRGQEANAAYFEGILAARKGDYAPATAKAQEFATLVEPDANPRKLEPMHEMMGMITLLQGEHAEAVEHFQQGNLNNPYIKYQLALAHEGAGNTEQAKELFGVLADYNFNNIAFALVRAEAAEKR